MSARRLSGLERIWLVADRIGPPFGIHHVVEWDGALDPDRWRRAIEAAAGPGMRLRLRGVLGRARWVVADGPVPVEVLPDAGWDGQGPTDWLLRPLPPTTAPVRVTLLPPTTGPARAVFSAHHAVTDGRGLWRFVVDTARTLAGEAVTPPPAGPLTDAALARSLGVTPLPAVESDAPPVCAAPLDQPITWRRRRLPGGSAVLPRLAAAFAHVSGGAPLRCAIPVDLRRYAAEADRDSTANLTGIVYLPLPGDVTPAAVRAALDDAIETRAAARHPLAADGVRGLPLGLLTALARRGLDRERRAGRFGASLTISHLGRHALTIDGHPARVAFVPPGSPGLPLFVGVTADPGGVEVVGSGPVAPDTLDALLDRVAAAYAALPGPTST